MKTDARAGDCCLFTKRKVIWPKVEKGDSKGRRKECKKRRKLPAQNAYEGVVAKTVPVVDRASPAGLTKNFMAPVVGAAMCQE
jgi:hypothetical protein